MQISSSSSAPFFANDALKDLWSAKAATREQNAQPVTGLSTADAEAATPTTTSSVTTVGSLATASFAKAASGSVGDVMDAYMSGQPKGEDKYIRAQEMSASALNTMRTAQSSILAAGMMDAQIVSSLHPGGNYAELALAGRKAARNMEQQKGQATLDQSQENLDDVSEDIEERAEAAVNPEEGDATTAESAASAENAAGAENAEKKDSATTEEAQAQGEDVSGQTTAAASPDTTTPQNSAQPQKAAPTQPSVDMLV